MIVAQIWTISALVGDKRGEKVNRLPFVSFHVENLERKKKKKKGKEKEEKGRKKRKKEKGRESGIEREEGRQQPRKRKEEATIHRHPQSGPPPSTAGRRCLRRRWFFNGKPLQL